MKRWNSILSWILLGMLLLVPGGVLICETVGYSFTLKYPVIHYWLIATVGLVLVVLRCCSKKAREYRKPILLLFAPLSMVNALFTYDGSEAKWIGLAMILSILFCTMITLSKVAFSKKMKPEEKWIIGTGVIYFFLLVIVVTMVTTVFHVLFGDFGRVWIERTACSPSGNYYAQVVVDDQGALGGNTYVDVYEDKGMDTFYFTICDEPERIYRGDWSDHLNMDLAWESEEILVINSVEYPVT